MDGIEVILGELIDMVQATAPMLWAIAQRQVLVNTVGSAVWAGLCILVTIVSGLAACHCVQQYREKGFSSSWDMAAILTGAVACTALIVALCCLNSVVIYIANPGYYAIKVLLELVQQ